MKNKKPKEKRVKPQKVKKEKNEKAKKERKPLSLSFFFSLFGLLCIATYLAIAIPMHFKFPGFSMPWFWFGFVAVAALVAPIGLFVEFLPRDPNKKQFTAAVKWSILLTLFVWFFDLLYMAVFNRWIVWEYIFGLIAIVLLFTNLTRSFLSGKKGGRWILPFEFLVDVGLSVYLIYRIPNNDLRTIVTTIAAALFGGCLTLVGVAWTIRHQKASQDEENRIHAIPYLSIKKEELQNKTIRAHFIPNEPLLSGGWMVSLDVFKIKNLSDNIVILKSMSLGGIPAVFESETVLEKNAIVKIDFLSSFEFMSEEKAYCLFFKYVPDHLAMTCSDVFGNLYEYQLLFEMGDLIEMEPKQTELFSSKLKVKSITAPKYIGKDTP